MPGITILLATGEEPRLRSALTLACAAAALGQPARIFFDAAAVGSLRQGAAGDAPPAASATLFATARDYGVGLVACQTGLAEHALTPADLIDGVEFAGVLAILADLGDDRLVAL